MVLVVDGLLIQFQICCIFSCGISVSYLLDVDLQPKCCTFPQGQSVAADLGSEGIAFYSKERKPKPI